MARHLLSESLPAQSQCQLVQSAPSGIFILINTTDSYRYPYLVRGFVGVCTPMSDRQTAAVLVLVSAFVHAAWNLAARAVKGDTAVIAGPLHVAPAMLCFGLAGTRQRTPRTVYVQVGTTWSRVLYTRSLLLLSHAYKIGELAVVYPTARGSSVVFVAVFSRLIIPDQGRMSTLGLIGIGVVVVGVGVMALQDDAALEGGAHKHQAQAPAQAPARAPARAPAWAPARAPGGASQPSVNSASRGLQLAIIDPRPPAPPAPSLMVAARWRPRRRRRRGRRGSGLRAGHSWPSASHSWSGLARQHTLSTTPWG